MVRLRIPAALVVTAALAMVLGLRGAAQQAGSTPPAPAPAPAPQQPGVEPTPERPIFRTGINFVRVDVIATAKGEPVTDLAQADFEVREDGKPQVIEQFRLI